MVDVCVTIAMHVTLYRRERGGEEERKIVDS
jgi:hypothetical protein